MPKKPESHLQLGAPVTVWHLPWPEHVGEPGQLFLLTMSMEFLAFGTATVLDSLLHSTSLPHDSSAAATAMAASASRDWAVRRIGWRSLTARSVSAADLPRLTTLRGA